MGGWGSGESKGYSTTDSRLRLDLSGLRKAGLLVVGNTWVWQWSRDGEPYANIQGRTETDKIVLFYHQRIEGDDWKPVHLPVRLEWTDCNYGGKRAWFRCPLCGRKSSVLYSGNPYFACRKCLRLNYACQRETKADRCWRRAHKLRVRIGGDDTLPADHEKPKGMYWRTFERLREAAIYYDNLAFRSVFPVD